MNYSQIFFNFFPIAICSLNCEPMKYSLCIIWVRKATVCFWKIPRWKIRIQKSCVSSIIWCYFVNLSKDISKNRDIWFDEKHSCIKFIWRKNKIRSSCKTSLSLKHIINRFNDHAICIYIEDLVKLCKWPNVQFCVSRTYPRSRVRRLFIWISYWLYLMNYNSF